jgi:hypothetical protein
MKYVLLLITAAAMVALGYWFASEPDASPSAEAASHEHVHPSPKQMPPTLPGAPAPLVEAGKASEPSNTVSSVELVQAKKQLEELKDKVVVVLGKVEDVGKQTSHMLKDWTELEELSEHAPATLTPEQKARLLTLQRQHAQALGILPEIAGFQDRPDEYGRFFRSMIQESLTLPDAQAAQVESYMRQRAEEMNRLGLNNGKEPTDAAQEAAWEQRRDVFNEQTFDGLSRFIPAETLKQAGFGPPLMELLENDFDQFSRP